MTLLAGAAPILAVIKLSDSFAAAWPDLADELGLQFQTLEPGPVPPAGTLAVIVAAGGEEDRAMNLLAEAGPWRNGVPVYVVAAQPSHRYAVEALRRGAADYFVLPPDLDVLRRTLQSRLETHRAISDSSRGKSGPDPFRRLIGESPALRATLDLARRVAGADATVLLTGETGTGKELLARALHDSGARSAGPFVAVNCAAIPANLLESELFGHERGAFTSAYQAKPGLFEEADGGTLFLDEVGHMPLELQGKLLRALEERRVRRVGATRSRAVDVRIVTATNVDLAEAVRRDEFREDLYYRLNVVNLELPPLRDRGRDAELLAAGFIPELAERYHLRVPPLTTEVLAALRVHRWPGNVRELRHAVERALLLSAPGTLDPRYLVNPAVAGEPPAGNRLSDVILAAARAAVARCGGNKSAAARDLGVSRQRLLRVLEEGDERGD